MNWEDWNISGEQFSCTLAYYDKSISNVNLRIAIKQKCRIDITFRCFSCNVPPLNVNWQKEEKSRRRLYPIRPHLLNNN
jgi:hypothetical protein